MTSSSYILYYNQVLIKFFYTITYIIYTTNNTTQISGKDLAKPDSP